MGGLFVVLVLAVAALAVWGQLSKRMARVHDASGHSVGGIEVGPRVGGPQLLQFGGDDARVPEPTLHARPYHGHTRAICGG